MGWRGGREREKRSCCCCCWGRGGLALLALLARPLLARPRARSRSLARRRGSERGVLLACLGSMPEESRLLPRGREVERELVRRVEMG